MAARASPDPGGRLSRGQRISRILVVEDDADYALLLRDKLERTDRIVDAVGTAREASQRVHGAYDAVVLDYCLPDASGLTVLRSIADAGAGTVPVVMLTGVDDLATAVRALREGAFNYLVKTPDSLRVLPEVVDQAVDEAYLRRELRRQTALVQRAEHMAAMGVLIGGLCHEMNNPLAGIIGYAELYLNKIAPDPRTCVETILVEARRIRDVVRALTAFASGDTPPAETLDVASAVEIELAAQEDAVRRGGVRVTFERPDEPVHVSCNGPAFGQVVANLVRNACRAMRDVSERRLDIWVQRAGNAIRIEFEDTGCGVPPELRERVFMPFFTTHGPDEGMGMGLAICHGIVTRQNGRIWCEAGSSGGALFVVEFPVADAPCDVA